MTFGSLVCSLWPLNSWREAPRGSKFPQQVDSGNKQVWLPDISPTFTLLCLMQMNYLVTFSVVCTSAKFFNSPLLYCSYMQIILNQTPCIIYWEISENVYKSEKSSREPSLYPDVQKKLIRVYSGPRLILPLKFQENLFNRFWVIL